MNILKKIKDSVIGLECIQAEIGYADVIKLDFGKKIYFKNPAMKDKYYGEVNISIETFNWRLVNEQEVICGSSDSYKNADKGLNEIIGKKVVEIESRINDFAIKFDNNFEFTACKATMENNSIVSLGIEKNNMKENFIYDGKEWKNYQYNSLSKDEVLLNEYSKSTTERWKSITPETGKENFCKDCSYFIEIAGKFYFWDYGVCTNEKSDFDGKIVNFKSTCKYYSGEYEFTDR